MTNVFSEDGAPRLALSRSLRRGTAWVGASSWVNRLMLVVVLAVLAARLTPRDFGVLSVAGLCRNVAVVVGAQGLSDALVFQRDRVGEAARTAFLAMTAFGGMLALGLFLVAPAVAGFFRIPDAVALIRGYAVVAAVAAASRAPLAMLTRELEFKRRFVPEGTGSIVGGLVTIVLAVAGVGVWSLLIGDLVREVIVVVLAIVVLPDRFGFGWSTEVAASLWRYGKHSFTSEMFEFGLQNIDYALIGRVLGPVALGYYTFAFRIAILPFLLVTYVLAGVSFPLYTRLCPDLERVRGAFRSIIEIGMNVTFFLAGGLVALAPSLQVLGARWEPSVAVIRALGVYVCLRSIAHFMTPLLAGTGHPGSEAMLRALWFAMLAGLIAAVAGRGVIAVGVVQVVVAAVMVIAYGKLVRRLVGVQPRDLAVALGRRAAPAVIGGLVVVALRTLGGVWVLDTSWLTLVLLGTAFTLAYSAGALCTVPGAREAVRRLV